MRVRLRLRLWVRVRVRGAARLDGLGVVLGDRVRAGLVRGRGRVREGEGEGKGKGEVRAAK